MASDRLLKTAAAALVAAALPAAPALGAGGLQVAPSKIDAVVRKGDTLPPIRVRNDSPRPVKVDVAAVVAGQELDGLPSYEATRSETRRGRRFLSLTPRRFRLAPGEARAVRARVTGGPRRGRGAYGVVLVRGRVADSQDGAVVTPVVRLAANILLAYRGRGGATGRLTDLRAAQAGPRQIDLIPRVTNRGRLHDEPRSRLVIRDRRDRVVLRQTVPAGNVLPGFDREFPTRLRKVLPAGRYVARVTTRLGDRRSARRLAFELVGPNELPTPALEISELVPPVPEPGEPFTLAAEIANRGTAPAGARGEVEIGPPGGEPTHRAGLEVPEVAPGETRRVEATVPGVPDGEHQLTVRLTDGDRVLAERTVVFSPELAPSMVERALEWITANLVAVLAAAIALIVLLALYAGVRIRRLQRRLREHAAAPAVRA